MIDGGPHVIKTPLRLSVCDHRRWLQPPQVGTAEHPIKDPPSPPPRALVLDVLGCGTADIMIVFPSICGTWYL